MTIRPPRCERYLAELLSAPPDSIDHRIAEDLFALDAASACSYLIDLLLEDPPESRPFQIAHNLLPLLTEEDMSR